MCSRRGPPRMPIQFLEGRKNPRCDERAKLDVRTVKEIEGERMAGVSGVEEDDVVCAITRHRRKRRFAQIAVRIHQAHPSAGTKSDASRCWISVDLPMPVLPRMSM